MDTAYISHSAWQKNIHIRIEDSSSVSMLFVSRAASAHGTRICGVAYWRAHDWNCLENFPNEALACNLLCKPVWTTPSALPPRSFSTHTHTPSWSRWSWMPVMSLGWCKAGNPLWKCRVMITGREEAEAVLELHNLDQLFMWHFHEMHHVTLFDIT